MHYCKDLKEVRVNIDRIDREIVKLIAERGQFVEQAAIFKNDEAVIREPQRIRVVINNVRSLAGEFGVDPDIVENVYRTMIDAFIDFELKEYRKIIEDEIK